jgi:hypothetical protein
MTTKTRTKSKTYATRTDKPVFSGGAWTKAQTTGVRVGTAGTKLAGTFAGM